MSGQWSEEKWTSLGRTEALTVGASPLVHGATEMHPSSQRRPPTFFGTSGSAASHLVDDVHQARSNEGIER